MNPGGNYTPPGTASDMPGSDMPGSDMPGSDMTPGTNTPAEKEEPEGPQPIWLEARLKVTQAIDYGPFVLIKHKWGQTLAPRANLVKFYDDPVINRYKRMYREIRSTDKNPRKLVFLAEWALKRGLMSEFHYAMEQLIKQDPKHAIAKTYVQVRDQMKKKRTEIDPSAQSVVRKITSEYKLYQSRSGYYTMAAKLKRKDTRIQDRLKILDATYERFYYWFALKGRVLSQPAYRLFAVLEASREDFLTNNILYNSKPMAGNGFTARRDNVLFLALNPTSLTYSALTQNNKAYFELAQVSNAKKALQVPVQPKMPHAKLQTLALIEIAVQEEIARTTTSHEAIRQLLTTTNLLPRNIATAEWLQYGIASFFEIPRKSFFDNTASPSWSHLITFRHYRNRSKKLPKFERHLELTKAESHFTLLQVVTDQYFSRAHNAIRYLPADRTADSPQEIRANRKLEYAQATSWALTYHVMNNRLDNVLVYLDELKKLPRDVEYDPKVLAGCFARAFGMVDPNSPGGISLKGTQRFAYQWYDGMSSCNLDFGRAESISLLDRLPPPPPPKKKRGSNNPPPNTNPPGFPGG